MTKDGRVNNFQVSAASTPFLTRQGQIRYKLAAGQPRPSMSHQTENETFFSNEVSWGMLSNTSLYGGLLLLVMTTILPQWVLGKICCGLVRCV